MKSYPLILLFLVSLFVFSCKDNLTDIGSGIQPVSDQIKIGTDTFHLTSENVPVDFITTVPDSFLLGNFYNTKFGSTKAEILAQLNCPVGFKFPPLSVGDSARIELLYSSWFGNKYDPMDVAIYQLNVGSPFDYSAPLSSNIDPSLYTDQSVKLAERVFTAKDVVNKRVDTTSIIFHLSPNFVSSFFDKYKTTGFPGTLNFLNDFHGIYITSNYGSSSLLNISKIYLQYFYHYTYTTKNIHGADSVVTVNNNIFFPANQEVRQVNRILHADRSTIAPPADSVNYISSPANFNTRVAIPLNKIQQRMIAGIAGKELTINSATMRVEATNIDVDTVAAPTTRYMLLMKEEAYPRFFKNNELPSDTCAMLGSHTIALAPGSTTVYEDYYSFNLAKLVANELKIAKVPADKLNMLLVPVQVKFNSSSQITAVKQDNLMDAVTIRSAKNTASPMRLKVVYSGF